MGKLLLQNEGAQANRNCQKKDPRLPCKAGYQLLDPVVVSPMRRGGSWTKNCPFTVFKETLVLSEERLMKNREWKFSLLGKFLGNRVMDPEFLTRTLCCQWKTKGSFNIIPMGNDFLTFKFNCKMIQLELFIPKRRIDK